jgi:glycosyltransferase involved in cell wall biosynthesis
MRITYLHQYFVTPSMGGGMRSYEFARRLVAAGHEVNVVTSFRERTAERDWFTTIEGDATVHWLPVEYSNNHDFRRRLRAFSRFAIAASRKATELDGDVVFATSTPLTVAIPGLFAAARRRVPLVFEVRDLWPEAPRQLGALRNPVLYWGAKALEVVTYRAAAHVVALSPGMREGVLSTGVSSDRITVIPNAADLQLFHPILDGSAVRRELGIGDRLMFLYFGTMGRANGLDLVLSGAKELIRRGEKNVVFVLHGDGMTRPHLERRKSAEGLTNVIFSGPCARKDMPGVVAAADVCMTIFANYPVLQTCSPNKMFDSFAAGKPVLTNMPGWLTDLLLTNGCGAATHPDDPIAFADAVQEMISRRSELPKMGRNARALAERVFDRDILAADLMTVLERARQRAA